MHNPLGWLGPCSQLPAFFISYGELAPYLRVFNLRELSQGRTYSSDRGMTMYADVWPPLQKVSYK
jgi:hypothetical protein